MDAPETGRARVIRVLVLDNDWRYREALARHLGASPEFDVRSGASIEEGYALAAEEPPDVMLADPNVAPDWPRDGTGERRYPDVPLIILTSSIEVDQLRLALTVDARGYIIKHAIRDPAEVAEAIRSAASGGVYFCTEARRLLRQLASASGRKERPYGLTARELEVLQLVAEGLSNKEIGARLSITEQAVKNHVGHILGKLRVQNRTAAALIAHSEGIVPPHPKSPPDR